MLRDRRRSDLDLRLIIITDHAAAAPRQPIQIVRACLEACRGGRIGPPAIQLRDKRATARELLDQARELRTLTRKYHAPLFVNDRLDIALAAGADGAHLGPEDLPLHAARKIVPERFILGFSTDVPERARQARDEGADYIGCGAVFRTASKEDAAGEHIGTERLDRVARAVSIPVVAIGGIGPENIDAVARTAAAGAAVLRSIMAASDPEAVVIRLLEAMARGG